jgi:hypothetical protein
MAQPSTFNTVASITQGALFEAKKLEEGQEPNSEQLARCVNKLNRIANHLQVKGQRLWTQTDYAITLVAGQSLYPLTGLYGKPLRIPKDLSYMLYTAANPYPTKVPVISLSQQEWVLLSQSGAQGLVSQIYVDKQLTALNVNTYLIPDTATAANYVLHVVYQAMMTPAMQITDQTAFPIEWGQTLVWLLAQQECMGQPQAVISRIDAMAKMYEDDMDGWDVEDAQTFFTPDTRNSYWGGRFR